MRPSQASADAWQRTLRYAEQHSLVIDPSRPLGHGQEGCVWRASLPPPRTEHAVKVFERRTNYERERNAYLRLGERSVTQLDEFEVPIRKDHDDDLMVIEMTIVRPPFIVDFGKAYVDCRPPYINDTEIMSEAEAKCIEDFGETRWRKIQRALWKLEALGIWYVDPTPGNIQFPDTGKG